MESTDIFDALQPSSYTTVMIDNIQKHKHEINNRNSDGYTPLIYMCSRFKGSIKEVNIIDELIKLGADPNIKIANEGCECIVVYDLFI